MATEPPGPDARQAPGLIATLRQLAATVVALLRTRLELLATEVEEERLRLAQIAAWGFLAVCLLALGLVMVSILVVVVFWDNRIAVVALLATLYIGAGVAIGFSVRAKLRAGSKLFSASLAELVKDRERLDRRDV